MSTDPRPAKIAVPVPPEHPYEHYLHGVARDDPWQWMSDHHDPALLAHLEAEREHYEAATAPLSNLRSVLYDEMIARIPTEETSGWWQTRGALYSLRLGRNQDEADLLQADLLQADPPAVALAPDALMAELEYADVELMCPGPGGRLLAYAVDSTGDERYELRFRDIEAGGDLPDQIPGVGTGGAWSEDGASFFYTRRDPAFRPSQVWRHLIGTVSAEDVLILDESDDRFHVRIHAAGTLVVLGSHSRTTSECWVIAAAEPQEPPRSVGGRRPGVQYDVHDLGDGELIIVTDDRAIESTLAVAPVPGPGGQDHRGWRFQPPQAPAGRVRAATGYAGGVVLTLRRDGGTVLRLVPRHDLSSPGLEVTSAFTGGFVRQVGDQDFWTNEVLYVDQSVSHPPVWWTLDLTSGRRRRITMTTVPGHDPDAYVTESVSFPADDGVLVPATLTRHRDTFLDGSAPALLYAYGAYETVFEPEWYPALPCLLDRGVVYVHAHVRGGGEGGRQWYLDGRTRTKPTTFTDHLAVASGLASAGMVDPARIATRGLSAGGLLQAAVMSRAPTTWRAVIAEVPFVDVVTTMLDPLIPLTVNEREEWGDPRDPAQFAEMLAWSPYENPPPAGGRPDLLVTGALHDARVPVHEPAKWVARLRATDPDSAPQCLFRVETGAGSHSGPHGRRGRLAYEAELYAWVLNALAHDPE